MKNEFDQIKQLVVGQIFLKYGRQGKPHAKLV
jgi:hypothetical protein